MKMNLPPKIQKLIDQRVKSGKYRTAEDVVAAGLSTLKQQEDLGDFEPGELDKLLAVADEEIERGELLDGEEVFREIRKLGGKRQGKAG